MDEAIHNKKNFFHQRPTPFEILYRITNYLDVEDLFRLQQVSSSMKGLLKDDLIWRQLISKTFKNINTLEINTIHNPKHWFLYNLCVAPYYENFHMMPLRKQLELKFEEKLLYSKISYNTWVLPLRILHSQIQNDVTVLLIILQTFLIYTKLAQILTIPWLYVLAPLWIFDILYFCCVIIWFYFLAKSLITEQFAEVCLSGWLKEILNGLQMGHIWIDYLLFGGVSFSFFLFFPFLLVLKLDICHLLFVQVRKAMSGGDMVFKAFDLPWIIVFSPIIFGCAAILNILHRRVNYVKSTKNYKKLGFVKFLSIEFILIEVFFITSGLHLDGHLPTYWRYWYTCAPLWLIGILGVANLAGLLEYNEEGRWKREVRIRNYFLAKTSLICFFALFLVFLVDSVERKEFKSIAKVYTLPFYCLFGIEALCILFWLQDMVDFEGYQHYSFRKQFDFSIKNSMLKRRLSL